MKATILRKSVAGSTVATLDLVEIVEQPTHFSDGDDVVPTGDPASDKLGKRPPAKGVKETDDIFPETGDPDSNDAVAHVAYPTSVEAAPTYKSLDRVARSANAVAKSLVAKKGIADDIRETMDDLSGALHELREVEEVLVARQQRSQDQEGEIEHAREVSASAAG